MKGFYIGGFVSGNINTSEKASNVTSDGLLLCCGIIISLARKVAPRVKSDRLKVMLWCRVVLWEIARLDVWCWCCGLWAGLRAVDGLGCCCCG